MAEWGNTSSARDVEVVGLNPGSGTSLLGGGGGVVKALVSGSRGYGFDPVMFWHIIIGSWWLSGEELNSGSRDCCLEPRFSRIISCWVAVAEWEKRISVQAHIGG